MSMTWLKVVVVGDKTTCSFERIIDINPYRSLSTVILKISRK